MFLDIILFGLIVILAAGTYLLKRHAGTLVLAVMAGGLVASVAAATVAQFLSKQGVTIPQGQPEAVVGAGITLLPALLTLFIAPKNTAKLRRLIGGLVFGVVAATLVVTYSSGIFAESLVAQSHLVDILTKSKTAVLTGGLVYALIDLLLGKRGAGHDAGHKK